jgi:hypothetical protein
MSTNCGSEILEKTRRSPYLSRLKGFTEAGFH